MNKFIFYIFNTTTNFVEQYLKQNNNNSTIILIFEMHMNLKFLTQNMNN